MKLFFFLSCFITLTAQAQTRDELYNQLNSLLDSGQIEEALPIARKFVEVTKNETGEEHIEYSNAVTYLGVINFNLGKLRNADSLFLLAATLRKKLRGPNDESYLSSLKDIAIIQNALGNPDSALVCLEQAAKAWKETKGEISFEHANILDNIASVYKGMANVEKADSTYIEAGDIWRIVVGESSEEYIYNLYNRASIYDGAARYDMAEKTIREYLSIQEKRVGTGHTEYASGISLLGLVYMKLGQFEKAEPLLREVVITEKNSGNEASYAIALGNLANMYLEIGHYKKALPIMEESTDILKKLKGALSHEYATGLSNLSVLFSEMQEYDESIAKAEEAVAIRRKILDPSDPAYASGLSNLAGAYFEQKKHDKAAKLFAEVIELRRKTLGEDHPEYAQALSNMATLNYEIRQYEKTENLLLEAMAIRERTLGEKHPEYAINLNNLAILYTTLRQFEKAERFMMKSNSIKKNNIVNSFTLLSENEKAEYLQNRVWVVDETNSFLYNAGKATPEFLRHSFDQLIFIKSMLLSDSRNMLKMVQDSNDENLRKIFGRWRTLQATLSGEYANSVQNRSVELKKMEAEAEMLEKELMQQSAEFRRQQQSLTAGFSEIRSKLAADEAVIEFVRFDFMNGEWTDSTMYAAYILRKQDPIPVFIPLCEEAQLQKIFDSAGVDASSMVSKFYRGLEGRSKSTAGVLGTELYKLVWAPLEPYLNGIKVISYSPAGKLYSLAFHALPVDSSSLLMDKYELRQYASTRDITLHTEISTGKKPASVVLFGDPVFSLDSLQLGEQRKNKQDIISSTNLAASLTSANNDSLWSELPGSAEEVKKVKWLFDQNKISTQSFTRHNASEAALKALSGKSPQLLHIATHGFFLPEPGNQKKYKGMGIENTYTLANDPLLRSGLILSGGNYAWSGKAPLSGVEDGIVTSYEIAQLDLSGTELVVLSACETALGDIKGSEGVFGLQRAFKMAGVKKMIVSLWQVPDKETAELMTQFYTYLINGDTIEAAFQKSQADMRIKYSAFYWAAFVLVE